jgi:Lar family restriction alleviation protein
MGKLKPCPFCGGDENGEVHRQQVAYTGGLVKWEIMCEGCGVTTWEFDTLEEAIEAWNTRYEPPTPGGAVVPAGNERLEK